MRPPAGPVVVQGDGRVVLMGSSGRVLAAGLVTVVIRCGMLSLSSGVAGRPPFVLCAPCGCSLVASVYHSGVVW